MFEKHEKVGCGVHLNPNGSDLRCGQKINNRNWNENEGVVQLCVICELKQRNNSLMDALQTKQKVKP
ncbi:hypothetical protein [Yersinia frederiksenii]|uniref:hypothetical protein n=1 Tax=Yersinia frederiksenii TaxID=29484 RepID=UPI0011A4FF9A|nr:hypothetical protein [Yersinia frederiksenii]